MKLKPDFWQKCLLKHEVDAEKAAQKLVDRGVEKVIITLGSKGAFVVTKTEKANVPAFKVKAVDTTAAGDTFCGTFAVALVEGKSLKGLTYNVRQRCSCN
jgi:ribokinase